MTHPPPTPPPAEAEARKIISLWAVISGLTCDCGRRFPTDGAASNPNLHDQGCNFVSVVEEVTGLWNAGEHEEMGV